MQGSGTVVDAPDLARIDHMEASLIYCASCGAANPLDATSCFACGHPDLVATSLTASPPPGVLSPTTLLKQRYRLLAQIGKGGFGAVYKAEDTQPGDRQAASMEGHHLAAR
jgi:ribosomal protein L40E